MSPTEGPVIVLPGLQEITVAVTGGASGIGRASAVLAARSGAKVVAGDTNMSALDELTDYAKSAGLSIQPMHLDVSDPASVAEFVQATDSEGTLAGLVSSAGIAPAVPILDLTLELWNKVLAVNLTGTFLVAQLAAKAMVEHGGGGAIVNVASAASTTGVPGLAHYSASKAGVVALTKTLARELGKHNIRVNAVSPGAVDTPLYWDRPSHADDISRLPISRIGTPNDLAYCIGFLLSDLSPWITGQNINVNGGSLMY